MTLSTTEARKVDHQTPPLAPTNLRLISVTKGEKEYQWIARIEWQDNATEENLHMFQYTRLDGSAGGSFGVYYYQYENPGEVTGLRVSDIIISEGEFTMHARAVNQHELGFGVDSEWSEPIGGIVAAPEAGAKPGKSGEKGNPNKP